MRHGFRGRRFNRSVEHRQAMFANMAQALIKHEQITTTLPKAKDLRPIVEKLVTLAKRGDLNSRRNAVAQIRLPRWSTGRTVLLGDAAWATGPFGTGTTLALVGAYILAGELGQDTDTAAALGRYEERMRPFVAQAQDVDVGRLDRDARAAVAVLDHRAVDQDALVRGELEDEAAHAGTSPRRPFMMLRLMSMRASVGVPDPL